MWAVSMIDTLDENALVIPFEERLGVEALEVVIINFKSNDINEYNDIVNKLIS